MKKLLSIILLSSCVAAPTYKRCTVILRVDSSSCYETCLTYSRLSSKSPDAGLNNNFTSCLREVCRGGAICLENNQPSPMVDYKP
jgi:hypothetical protein